MRFEVALTPDAISDIGEALDWYRGNSPDLAAQFFDDVNAVLKRLQFFALTPPPAIGRARRIALRVFPYNLWYVVDDAGAEVTVIALIHHRRNPAFTDSRVTGR